MPNVTFPSSRENKKKREKNYKLDGIFSCVLFCCLLNENIKKDSTKSEEQNRTKQRKYICIALWMETESEKSMLAANTRTHRQAAAVAHRKLFGLQTWNRFTSRARFRLPWESARENFLAGAWQQDTPCCNLVICGEIWEAKTCDILSASDGMTD